MTDYTLTPDQLAFMTRIDPAAEQADRADDYAFFERVVASEEWRRLFGGMGWDQAYDRYEIAVGRCADCGSATREGLLEGGE